jgi:hypothetical protein
MGPAVGTPTAGFSVLLVCWISIMPRFLAFLLMVVVCLTVVSGCGEAQPEPKKDQPAKKGRFPTKAPT